MRGFLALQDMNCEWIADTRQYSYYNNFDLCNGAWMLVRDFRRPIFPLGNSKCYFETGDVTGCEGARREAENYELYARRLPLPS